MIVGQADMNHGDFVEHANIGTLDVGPIRIATGDSYRHDAAGRRRWSFATPPGNGTPSSRSTPASAVLRVVAAADAPDHLHRTSSLVSVLSSAIVHLLVLILLGLVVVPALVGDPNEIHLTLTPGEVAEPLETISFASATAPTDYTDDVLSPTPMSDVASVKIEDPTLVVDFEDASQPAASSIDLTARFLAGAATSGGNQGATAKTSGLKGEFFGVTAYGDKFVYLLDMSTSMAKRSRYGRTRFQVAAEELIRSVQNLSEEQEFYVILFSYKTRLMFDGQAPRMLPATDKNKQLLRSWLSQVRVDSGTDPRIGVMMGLRIHPSAIFLLSDGEFNGREENPKLLPGNPKVEQIIAANGRQYVPIHTIAFEDKRNRKRLRRISQATGGTHRFVTSDDRIDVLFEDLTGSTPDDVLYAIGQLVKEGDALSLLRRRRAAPVLVKMLAAPSAVLREGARQALLAISEGNDFGPAGEQPTKQEIVAAQASWAAYWSELDVETPPVETNSEATAGEQADLRD